jgi:4-diphosphocytidyl-2-C-methyl-D-erythritol kinase
LANAKINLFLDIRSKRSDGYHEILSVFREVRLTDVLSIRKSVKTGLSLHADPQIKENILRKTYDIFTSKYGIYPGLVVKLRKRIPLGGGLGGGSSDAAVFLRFLFETTGMRHNASEMIEMAAEIGSDVPFFLQGGCAIVRGKGEQLEYLTHPPQFFAVLVNPGFPINTAESYRGIRSEQHGRGEENFKAMIQAMRDEDVRGMALSMYNVFETNALVKYPVLGKIKEMLVSCGAENALMSGSGSTIFGVFIDKQKARKAAGCLRREFPKTFLVQTQ